SQIRKDISLSADRDIFRFIIMLDVNAELTLGKVPYMSLGCRNCIIAPKKFFDCLHLCRRLHDNKIMCHKTRFLRPAALLPSILLLYKNFSIFLLYSPAVPARQERSSALKH